MSRRCPTLRKVAYATQREAHKHVAALYAKEGKAALVHSYKCRCGSWHVGGRQKHFGRKRVQW